MSNLYHILYKLPVLEKDEMFIELEEMAEALYNSGKIRIDAVDKIDYVRFTIPSRNINMMFSKKELTDRKLLPYTRKSISSAFQGVLQGNHLNKKVDHEINRLSKEIDKYQKIDNELGLKLARIIVQSAHPSVILLLLIEKVEIFISYSHNIGDMLDIVSWQHSGENSGMQSTNGVDVAIFTSSGGDPFIEGEKDLIYGDGIAALARMTVIAAQEIGHYSDIMRDKIGRQISRFSANFSGTIAKDDVRIGRLRDLDNIKYIEKDLYNIGLQTLFEYERHLKFFIKNKRYGIIYLWTNLKISIFRKIFILRSNKIKQNWIKEEVHERYIASKIVALIADMKFNLQPIADVYKSNDKKAEEAIACIEALARIPQQRLKWGKNLTRIFTPNLYNIYYKKIIPECIKTYQNITNKKYNIKLKNIVGNRLYLCVKNLFKKKPKMYKIWNY